jgi:choline dehydrogenase
MTTYASRANLDAWSALGNPGFSWDEMAPYFRKFTTFHQPSSDLTLLHNAENLTESLNTTSGPIHTAFYPWRWSAPKRWVETWKNLGFARKTDPRSGTALGGGSLPSFLDPESATRSYAATGFYAPNADRPNLSVLVEAHVNKIELETSKSNVRATGVHFTAQGKHFTVTAKREVILCAGTVKSPQLLELSGIGSPALLESHSIPVVVAIEGVGENLRDHLLTAISCELSDGIESLDSLRNPAVLEKAMTEFRNHRTGPMASGLSYDAYTVFSDVLSDSDKAELATLVAEIEAMDVPTGLKKQDRILTKFLLSPSEPSGRHVLTNGQTRQMTTDGDIISWKPKAPGNHVIITACVSHPFGRGSIHITTADPTANPAIDPRYLSHPADLFMMAKLVQYVQKFVAPNPLPRKSNPMESGCFRK